MENIKIWHTPDEKPEVIKFDYEHGEKLYEDEEKVEIIKPIVMFGKWAINYTPFTKYANQMWEFERFNHIFDTEFGKNGNILERWCYYDELIATSKALDVAIDALYHFELEDGRVGNFAGKTLYEINRIMKGDKS